MSYKDTKRSKIIDHDNQIKKYGINIVTYEFMLQEQDGKCWICGLEDNEGKLAVDHDHNTGEVRGLLCRNCNRGLGMFRDDPTLLLKAHKFLTREYQVPHQPELERIPQDDRARWRNIVHTPDGTFASFDEAGVYYDVHPTTVGGWCGAYKGEKYKGSKREGFSFTKKFCSLNEVKK